MAIAAHVDVLAVRALGLVALNDSLLRGPLSRRATPVRMRVLLLDPEAPSAAVRAAEIGESLDSFTAGIRLSLARLAEFADHPSVSLQSAVYAGLPTWRMLRFDDVLYLSAFGASSEGHRSGMHKLTAATNGVLHAGSCVNTMMPGSMPAVCEEPGVIEAELKARVRDPERLRKRLGDLADGETSTYHDMYYDWPGRQLSESGRELRLRLVVTAGLQQSLLTYKDPAVDSASGSKPEHQTEVADPSVIDVMLRALGLVRLVAFEKHCTNYRFAARGRDMLATVVRVPELDGTFLELETMADEDSTAAALADVRTVLHQLGIAEDDLTTEQYTEAVLKAREWAHIPGPSGPCVSACRWTALPGAVHTGPVGAGVPAGFLAVNPRKTPSGS